MISAHNLTKRFGESNAVNGISLEIRKGECFGLLGPNGAGKSTFIGMLYGVVQRTTGELRIFGLDPTNQSREIKKRMGVVTQENALDESLTVLENMLIYAAFLGVPKSERRGRIDELLEYMNLSHKKDMRIQTLSGGMKRRLVFVRALLGRPDLLILDEPTTGLDPSVRHLIWGKVKELRERGTTILLTTHYMHEAEVLCDRLVILNQGAIVAEGAPGEMIETYTPGYVGIYGAKYKVRIEQLVASRRDLLFTEDSSGIYLRARLMDELAAFRQEHGLEPLQIRPANLEDVFLKLTGREITTDA
jgi:lipooligosaccharide transport system ATP-binding protein